MTSRKDLLLKQEAKRIAIIEEYTFHRIGVGAVTVNCLHVHGYKKISDLKGLLMEKLFESRLFRFHHWKDISICLDRKGFGLDYPFISQYKNYESDMKNYTCLSGLRLHSRGLSIPLNLILKRYEILYVSDLKGYTSSKLLNMKNFGRKALRELREFYDIFETDDLKDYPFLIEYREYKASLIG